MQMVNGILPLLSPPVKEALTGGDNKVRASGPQYGNGHTKISYINGSLRIWPISFGKV